MTMKVGDVISWPGQEGEEWEVQRVSPMSIIIRNTETRRIIQISPSTEGVRVMRHTRRVPKKA